MRDRGIQEAKAFGSVCDRGKVVLSFPPPPPCHRVRERRTWLHDRVVVLVEAIGRAGLRLDAKGMVGFVVDHPVVAGARHL